MSIFSPKANYLGIDIGTSSIKVVELANFKGRPRLVTYGFIEKKPAEVRNLVCFPARKMKNVFLERNYSGAKNPATSNTAASASSATNVSTASGAIASHSAKMPMTAWTPHF